MKIFSFSTQNLKGRPNEDCFLISKKLSVFTVADGVSRSRNSDGSYPEPSGARLAAGEFCKSTATFLKNNFKKADLETLRKAFDFVNKVIFNLNEKYGINKKLDYLINDYFSACGAAGFIKKNFLYYGYLGDCGIRVYSQNDLLRLVSINDIAPLEEYRDNLKFESQDKKRIFWRKTLRNKPNADYLTYGVFTGEPEAASYYHFGEIKLNPGDLVFFYSDGFSHFIKVPEFRELFRSFRKAELEQRVRNFVEAEIKKNPGKETSETFGDDKTLIAILVE